LQYFCRMGWPIPEHATHLSVDCTVDHQLKQEALDEQRQREETIGDYYDGDNATELGNGGGMDELEKLLIVAVALVSVAVLICCLSVYMFVVRPYYELLKEQKQLADVDNRQTEIERQGLVAHQQGDDPHVSADSGDTNSENQSSLHSGGNEMLSSLSSVFYGEDP
jgi:hypothetical protein